jgi:hypothetical protein
VKETKQENSTSRLKCLGLTMASQRSLNVLQLASNNLHNSFELQHQNLLYIPSVKKKQVAFDLHVIFI